MAAKYPKLVVQFERTGSIDGCSGFKGEVKTVIDLTVEIYKNWSMIIWFRLVGAQDKDFVLFFVYSRTLVSFTWTTRWAVSLFRIFELFKDLT